MHQLPFKPRTLTLAIAAVLVASQPLTDVKAESLLSSDEQWSCQVAPNGTGWQCTVQPVKQGALQRAPRPAAPASATSEKTAPAKPRTVATSSSRASLKTQLDWVPKTALTQEQQEALDAETPWCEGRYIEPVRPGLNFKGDPDSAPIVAEADESVYDEASVATLKGNITVRQGNRQLQADTATMNRERNHAEFNGNVIFREPGIVLTGDSGDMTLDTGRASIQNASYALHNSHLRGSSSEIVRNEDATMELNDATYTSCRLGDNGWELSGENVTLDPSTGFGSARNAVVRVKGLPIFYTPYIHFPIDDRRQSGFLYPTIGYGSDNGAEFSIPYYWNIAPNYDATITPRYMANRGFLLENEFRYLGSSYSGELGFAGLANKDELKDDNRYYDKDRWLANIRHQQFFTERWTAEVDYADASDKGYLDDFGTNLNLSSTAPLNQSISTRYYGGSDTNNWQLTLDAHRFKNMNETADDPYNKLPQIVLNGSWLPNDRVNVSYLADYTYFSRDKDWHYVEEVDVANRPDVKKSIYDEGYGIKKAEGGRSYFESGVSFPMVSSGGFLTPEIKVISLNYNLNNLNDQEVLNDLNGAYGQSNINQNGFTDSPNLATGSFSLDSGLFFDRMANLFGTDYTHTFEPRAKYLYVPYVDDQEFNPIFDTAAMNFTYSSLWEDNRFSGYDRIGDTNQLALGFTTRLIEDDGFERVRFGLGQIIYFKDRKVYIASGLGQENTPANEIDENYNAVNDRIREDLKNATSPLASELVYNINSAMSLRQDFAWNTSENRVDNYGLSYRWHPEKRKAFNAGVRYRSQVDRYVQDKNDKNEYIDPNDTSKGFKTTSDDVKQSDISFAWPMPFTQNWSAMGRWQHDFTNQRNLEELLGVEYNSCCYQVRLFWRSWIEPDDNIDHPDKKSGVFLQFVLRGLGDITGGSGSEYLQGIQGYETREK